MARVDYQTRGSVDMQHILVVLTVLLCWDGRANESVVPEYGTDSYHYISSHSISIDATPTAVWPHLERLDSWMFEFELSNVAGELRQPGEVLRLYPEQEFYVQILESVAPKLLVMANLPSVFGDESSTGIGVMSLHANGSRTDVTLTMSRRYTWLGKGENPQLATRSSSTFQDSTAALWARFLERLKTLAER